MGQQKDLWGNFEPAPVPTAKKQNPQASLFDLGPRGQKPNAAQPTMSFTTAAPIVRHPSWELPLAGSQVGLEQRIAEKQAAERRAAKPPSVRKPASVRPLHTFHNAEDGVTSYIYANGRGGYVVRLQDVESGEFLPSSTTFPDVDRAIKHAQELVAGVPPGGVTAPQKRGVTPSRRGRAQERREKHAARANGAAYQREQRALNKQSVLQLSDQQLLNTARGQGTQREARWALIEVERRAQADRARNAPAPRSAPPPFAPERVRYLSAAESERHDALGRELKKAVAAEKRGRSSHTLTLAQKIEIYRRRKDIEAQMRALGSATPGRGLALVVRSTAEPPSSRKPQPASARTPPPSSSKAKASAIAAAQAEAHRRNTTGPQNMAGQRRQHRPAHVEGTIDSVAALKRLPIGTRLRMISFHGQPCDSMRVLVGVLSKGLDLRVDDPQHKGHGQVSRLDLAGWKVAPTGGGFIVTPPNGGRGMEYVVEGPALEGPAPSSRARWTQPNATEVGIFESSIGRKATAAELRALDPSSKHQPMSMPGAQVYAPYRDPHDHTGEVLSRSAPEAWEDTLAFPGRRPSPESARAHAERQIREGRLGGVPVRWSFGKTHWETKGSLAPLAEREVRRMSGDALRSAAAEGNRAAQTELDRRATK